MNKLQPQETLLLGQLYARPEGKALAKYVDSLIVKSDNKALDAVKSSNFQEAVGYKSKADGLKLLMNNINPRQMD